MKAILMCMVLAFSVSALGCATMKSIGGQTCDAIFGGSVVGEICSEIANLGGGDLPDAPAE
jgi:hypothetical protein